MVAPAMRPNEKSHPENPRGGFLDQALRWLLAGLCYPPPQADADQTQAEEGEGAGFGHLDGFLSRQRKRVARKIMRLKKGGG
jgi:hypothetical protein